MLLVGYSSVERDLVLADISTIDPWRVLIDNPYVSLSTLCFDEQIQLEARHIVFLSEECVSREAPLLMKWMSLQAGGYIRFFHSTSSECLFIITIA